MTDLVALLDEPHAVTRSDQYSTTTTIQSKVEDKDENMSKEDLNDFRASTQRLSPAEFDTKSQEWQQNKVDKLLFEVKDTQEYSHDTKSQLSVALAE